MQINFVNFSNHEDGANLAFSQNFLFYPVLDCYKIRTRANFKNPNGKISDINLIM